MSAPTAISAHGKAQRAFFAASRKEDEFPNCDKHKGRVIFSHKREADSRTPMYAYSHEEIDAHFDGFKDHGSTVAAAYEPSRAPLHVALDEDVSRMRALHKASGYAAAYAALERAIRAEAAALDALTRYRPRSLREAATVARYLGNLDKRGTLNDGALSAWLRHFGKLANMPAGGGKRG